MFLLRQAAPSPKSAGLFRKQPKEKKGIFQFKVNVKHHYPYLRDKPFDAKPFSNKYKEKHSDY